MKRNKLTLLVAVLLLGAMLLASCSPDPTDPVEPPLFNEVENNHSEAIGAWAEYLSYVAPEKTPEYKATEILSNLKINDAAEITDELIVVVEEKENFKTIPAEEGVEGALPTEVKVSTSKTIKWYNKNTGELVKTLSQLTAEQFDVEGTWKYDETVDPAKLVWYEIVYADMYTGLIRVKTTTLQLKEQEEGAEALDTAAVSSYESKAAWSYYLPDGTLFLENLEGVLTKRSVDNAAAAALGRYLIDCEETGKTYLMEDGELVREFDYKAEYNVPVYDEDNCTYTWDSGYMTKNVDDYAYFEHNGNKYVITEELPATVRVGELTMFLVQGMSIYVTDKDDKPLVSYETECYGITGYAVLSNGNIYTCEFELLARDAAEYDVLSGEDKLNVHHKLINITDGSVTELDLGFKAAKLFNNTTKEINSFLNYATLEITDFGNPTDALLESASVKDGYILAEIQKHEGGVLDGATTWAVLDESLNIVKELPAIIADQFTYPSFMDAETMIVSARTVGNEIINYAADLESGEMTLLPDTNALNRIQILNNGYFWNKKVYDKDWNVLKDFNNTVTSSSSYTVYAGFHVINGDLYYYSYSSTVESLPTVFDWTRLEITRNEKTEYVWEYDEELEKEVEKEISVVTYGTTTDFIVDDAVYSDGIFAYGSSMDSGKIYNIDGDLIIGRETYDEYIESEKLDNTVRYSVVKTINWLGTVEDGYLAVVRLAYTNDTSTTTEDSGIPQSFTEYEYYIIK
ncbi:MAG: hypothetical protein IJW48_01735 [Clostridia bacterium]|nr:hypothetical protein [Clostridia bacterium]